MNTCSSSYLSASTYNTAQVRVSDGSQVPSGSCGSQGVGFGGEVGGTGEGVDVGSGEGVGVGSVVFVGASVGACVGSGAVAVGFMAIDFVGGVEGGDLSRKSLELGSEPPGVDDCHERKAEYEQEKCGAHCDLHPEVTEGFADDTGCGEDRTIIDKRRSREVEKWRSGEVEKTVFPSA